MQLDPTFISTYANAVLMYPDHYNSLVDYTFLCFDSCSDCPFDSNAGCQIQLQCDLLDLIPSVFEQTHIAPLLRQSHPELFV